MKIKAHHRLGMGMGMVGGVSLFLLVFVLVLPGIAPAQEKYPAKPINFVIGYPAGGTTDICARPLVS
ncbi:MAG: hypothetical protein FJZ98_05575, partial [Chloroflexi bacterium]|nr:hypothetical protein [Chloroflexota bacterium]